MDINKNGKSKRKKNPKKQKLFARFGFLNGLLAK